MDKEKKIIKTVSLLVNKKALSEHEVIKEFEASMKLSWSEVKSIRANHFHLKASFVTIRDSRVYIQKMHISPYKMLTNQNAYDSESEREIFLHKRDTSFLLQKIKEKWFTIIPTEVYLKWNLIKMRIALARWKKLYERKEDIKRRDIDMEIKRSLSERI